MDRQLQEQQHQERRERLQVFLSKSQEWSDFRIEILEPIYGNAEMELKAINCANNREIYVGKCAALQEIYDAIDEIKMEKKQEK